MKNTANQMAISYIFLIIVHRRAFIEHCATLSNFVLVVIVAAMLATQLNDLVISKQIEVKAVIRLDKYICNIIQETR